VSKPRVKICGITRLQDVRGAVDAGADALGFVFASRSKRKLTVAEATPLVTAVPAFVSRVGLFMDQGYEEVARVLDRLPLSLLQFHGREDGAFCRRFGLPYIKALSMRAEVAWSQVEADHADAAGLLLDSHAPGGAGGTGAVFDWSAVPALTLPVVLAGGLNPGNVRRAAAEVKPWAVDVSSGVEDAPGIKNAQKMIEFVREAKSEY
jgi:phosphoribosylanthranilate isomerase